MIARYVLENLVWEVGRQGTEGWNDVGQCCCIKSGQGPFLLFQGSPDFGRGRLMTLLITEPLFTLTFKLLLHLHSKITCL